MKYRKILAGIGLFFYSMASIMPAVLAMETVFEPPVPYSVYEGEEYSGTYRQGTIKGTPLHRGTEHIIPKENVIPNPQNVILNSFQDLGGAQKEAQLPVILRSESDEGSQEAQNKPFYSKLFTQKRITGIKQLGSGIVKAAFGGLQALGGFAIAGGGTALSSGVLAPLALPAGTAAIALGTNNLIAGSTEIGSALSNIFGSSEEIHHSGINPIAKLIDHTTEKGSDVNGIFHKIHIGLDLISGGFGGLQVLKYLTGAKTLSILGKAKIGGFDLGSLLMKSYSGKAMIATGTASGALNVAARAFFDVLSGKNTPLYEYGAIFAGGFLAGGLIFFGLRVLFSNMIGGALGSSITEYKKYRKLNYKKTLTSSFGAGFFSLIPGISGARGSAVSISKQILTKLNNGTIKNIRPETVLNMFIGKSVEELPGAFIEESYDTISKTINCTRARTQNIVTPRIMLSDVSLEQYIKNQSLLSLNNHSNLNNK